MQAFPHHYAVSAAATPGSTVTLTAADSPDLQSAAPVEFDGPGGHWSPETLLVAAVADCFVLSFVAVARASRFEWSSLSCEVNGTLDRVDGKNRFTAFEVRPSLKLAQDSDRARAEKLLEKAETLCLITNSMLADTHLVPEILSA